jgi:hypothetical protein
MAGYADRAVVAGARSARVAETGTGARSHLEDSGGPSAGTRW